MYFSPKHKNQLAKSIPVFCRRNNKKKGTHPMSTNLHIPTRNENLKPTITVVGVGGAGGNAVNNMIASNLEGVSFVVANTDAQALDNALTDRVIQLGANITQGLGAGASPDIGRASAEEAYNEIMAHIEGSHMVFITAGMGGGTGTGAAPVVARMAREQGILTVAVVTKPFHFEGTHRMKLAESGLDELHKYVDTMIVIPNQNLFRIANERTTFADAFRLADEVLHSGVRGVTDLMVMPGLINLDFADIRTVMREMGKAMMGTGEAEGERRAVEAAEAAISNPLLDDVSMKGARGVLINITGGRDMTLFEVDEAANRIRDEVDPDANIIFGSTFNDALQGKMRISVVATGIDQQQFLTKDDGVKEPYTRTFSHRPAPANTPQNSGSSAANTSSNTTRSGLSFARPQSGNSSAASSASATGGGQENHSVMQQQSEQRESQAAVSQHHDTSHQPPFALEQEQGRLHFAESRDAARAGRLAPTRLETMRHAQASSSAEQGGEYAPARDTMPSPRGYAAQPNKMRASGAMSQAQTALWQEEDAEQDAHPSLIKRMTAKFTPKEEMTQPVRREITGAQVASDSNQSLDVPAFLRRSDGNASQSPHLEGGNHLEIPAFLRRQAN
jgi:cell division protein FtsZ